MWRRIGQALRGQAAAEAIPEAGTRAFTRPAGARPAPRGVTRYTFCQHSPCAHDVAGLMASVRREAQRLGLALALEPTLTLCDGACRGGPLLGLPERGLFYRGLRPGEVRRMLQETSLAGRLLHSRLRLDPTVVTDSRLVFERDENLLVAIAPDYCLVGLATYLFEFSAAESCGKCFPCRLGVHRVDRLLRGLLAGRATPADLEQLIEATWTLAEASYCQFGPRNTAALRLALGQDREAFERHLAPGGCGAGERFLWPPGPGQGRSPAAEQG